MKLIIHISFLIFTAIFGVLEVSDEIVASIKSGKASELVKNFDEKVSIRIIEQEALISKSQAEANLKYFFDKHPVKSFTSIHVSQNSTTLQYLTGTLETTNGKYRVSVLIKRNLVSQFRIENDNE